MTHDTELLCRAGYDQLKHWLSEHRCAVREYGRSFSDPAADFKPLTSSSPSSRLRIFRSEGQRDPGPAIEELTTLAHEAGHWVSWDRNERPEQSRYAAAADTGLADWTRLPASEKQMIREEEVRAWKYGRELLSQLAPALPIELLTAFARSTEDALADYDRLLGLTPSSLA
jgi:hypothetical protein